MLLKQYSGFSFFFLAAHLKFYFPLRLDNAPNVLEHFLIMKYLNAALLLIRELGKKFRIDIEKLFIEFPSFWPFCAYLWVWKSQNLLIFQFSPYRQVPKSRLSEKSNIKRILRGFFFLNTGNFSFLFQVKDFFSLFVCKNKARSYKCLLNLSFVPVLCIRKVRFLLPKIWKEIIG